MIPDLKFGNRNLTICCSFQDKQCLGGSQIKQFAECRAGLGPTPALEPLPHENEHHDDGGGLEVQIGAMVPMGCRWLQEQQDDAVKKGCCRAESDQREHVQLP